MVCEICGRKAIYYSKKKKRLTVNRDHSLCRRCYRDARNHYGHRKGRVEYPVDPPESTRC